MINIVKSFDYQEYAQNHSHDGYRDKALASFGVDVEKNLYFRGQISGFGFPNTWVRLGSDSGFNIPFTLAEMQRITKELS